MRVLVACEFSGIVRDAFAARGHDAWSWDLLPTENPGPHVVGDVLNLCADEWDMLIAFPPCTHLCVSGARWFKNKQQEQKEALAFVWWLMNVNVPKIAIENPVGVISTKIRKPDQIIQPWQFGHPESKTTCLWLKGLPKLIPTQVVEPVWWKNADGTDYKDGKGKRYSPTHFLMGRKQIARWANQTASGQNKLGPSPDRWKLRSKTYQGIADAMAEQWGVV